MNQLENEYLARCAYCDYISTRSIVKEHIKIHEENQEIVLEENFNEETEETAIIINESEQSTGHHWTDPEVKLLISLYEKRKAEFEGKKLTNRRVWQLIADEMNKLTEQMFTWEQCDNKLKNLKKTYKKVCDNNGKTGRGRFQFKYFDLLDNLFRKNPEINPISECSSMIEYGTYPSTSNSGASTPAENAGEDITPTRKSKKRKADDEPMWFKRFREDTERRHQERLHLQEKMISVIDKFLNENNK